LSAPRSSLAELIKELTQSGNSYATPSARTRPRNASIAKTEALSPVIRMNTKAARSSARPMPFAQIWRNLFAAFCFFAMPPFLFAGEFPFLFTPVSAAASGGMHVAAEDGVFTLLGNPALLNAVSQSMYFSLSGGIGNFIEDGTAQTMMPPVYYTVAGPLALGTVSKGVGYGLFNYIRIHEDGIDLHGIGSAGIDWILVDGASLKLDLGLSPRFLFSYTQADSGVLSAVSLTPGILLSLGDRFSAGISYANALSGALRANESGSEFTMVSSSLDVGIMAGAISNAALGLTLFADYRNILGLLGDDAGDPLGQLGCGLRAEFGNSFWISFGLSESFFAAGFGLNLGPVKLETAFFASGVEAGIKIVRD
jgi:hypothetical protein